ncbi:hypothetical protein E5676_scaffold220G00610 [Cucumis melo var. makuwa]|uniref:Uncharacterized protein n=1 Tax=Cucumis melo var. makuwa TaxID=1194695 RepID=A0A5D3BD82_CUCMM|nr:hypothetical protein E5676_scaffold220G00610 [Cucumis melo var. makuwa]
MPTESPAESSYAREPPAESSCAREPSQFLLSGRVDSPVFEPSACSSPLHLVWSSSRNFDLRTSLLGKRDLTSDSTGPPVWHGYRYDSSDSTGSSQTDCLSVSSGYATDQFVLGAEVRARASWRATRSDRGVVSISAVSICVVVVCEKFLLVKLQEKMSPRRGSRRGGGRGGRGAGRI